MKMNKAYEIRALSTVATLVLRLPHPIVEALV